MLWPFSRAGRRTISSSKVGSPLSKPPYQQYADSDPSRCGGDPCAHSVNNDIRGLLNSVNDGSTSAFMWEWFTTKPFVDAGEARFVSPFPSTLTPLPGAACHWFLCATFIALAPPSPHHHQSTSPLICRGARLADLFKLLTNKHRAQIGSVPTPWPSWLIAAHPTRAPASALTPFLTTLSTYVRTFDSAAQRAGPDVAFIKDKFGYPEEDITVSPLPSPPSTPAHRVADVLVSDGRECECRRGSRPSGTRRTARRSPARSSRRPLSTCPSISPSRITMLTIRNHLASCSRRASCRAPRAGSRSSSSSTPTSPRSYRTGSYSIAHTQVLKS